MKKNLLLMGVMLLTAVGATAQKQLSPAARQTVPPMQQAMKYAPMQTTFDATRDMIMASQPMSDMHEVEITTSRSKAPRRTLVDGVWYQRPEGSFYVSGSSAPNYWAYLYQPAFAEAIYKNMSENKEASKWSLVYQGEADPMEADEDYNLPITNGKVANGYISTYFIPQLTVGTTDYTFGENFKNSPQVALINGDSIEMVTDVNLAGGYYYGFSNGASFGNRTTEFTAEDGSKIPASCDAIYEFYKKPISPICLSNIYFRVVNYEGTPLMNEDTEMHVYIQRIDDEGNLADIIADMPFTLNDTVYYEREQNSNREWLSFGAFQVSQKEQDAFGTEYEVPVIIKDAFAIVISGFNLPGVNFSLYMCDVSASDTDYFINTDMVTPTCRSYVRDDNGEPIGGLYYCQAITKEQSDQYNKEDGDNYDWTRHYQAVIHLSLMSDVVRVFDDFKTMYAREEGGNILALVDEENEETGEMETVAYGSIQYQTTLPRLSDWEGLEGEDNYEFEMSDWLSVDEHIDDYYSSNYGYTTLTVINAEPLPEGMKGRKGEIRIVSERGADSGVITVIQGEVGDDVEEETVPFDMTTKVSTTKDSWIGATGTAGSVTTALGVNTPLAEVYNSSSVGTKMYQTLSGLEDGTYEVKLFATSHNARGEDGATLDGTATDVAYIFAASAADSVKTWITASGVTPGFLDGEQTTPLTISGVKVVNGELTLGLDVVKEKMTGWHTIQIYSLTQQVPLSKAWELAKAEAEDVLTKDMEASVKDALTAALEATKSVESYNALNEALQAAKASANAYANAATALTAMKALVDATNVYTKEAYEAYYGEPAAKFEAKTLATAEAAALQNPEVVTAWHAAVTVDNFLLSAWDTNPDFDEAPYYINTWSVEGDNDGSLFRVPFFEYWTGDGDSLGERILTATMDNVENGEYEVTAWTRVRAKNGYTAPAYGIALQVNDGAEANVADGDQVGSSQFFLKSAAAKGNVTDGTLKIKFNVAQDNNVSWLSFKNVMFKRLGDVNAISTVNAAQQNAAQVYNLQGQKVQQVKKGLYIQNGKKVVK